MSDLCTTGTTTALLSTNITTTTTYQYHSTATTQLPLLLLPCCPAFLLPCRLSLAPSLSRCLCLCLCPLLLPWLAVRPPSLLGPPSSSSLARSNERHWPRALPLPPIGPQVTQASTRQFPVTCRCRCRPLLVAQACSSKQKAPLFRPPSSLFSTPLCCLSLPPPRRPVLPTHTPTPTLPTHSQHTPTQSPVAAHPVASVLFRRACPLSRPLRMLTRPVALGACPRPSSSARTHASARRIASADSTPTSSRLPPSRPLSLRRPPTHTDEQRTTWPPGLAPAARAPRTCPTAPSPTAPTAAPPPLPRQSPLLPTRP